MKIPRGIQNLGNYHNSKISIDWSYLIEEHGKRQEHNDTQRSIGFFVKYISVISLILLIIVDFTIGNFLPLDSLVPDRSVEIIFWIMLGLYIYSIYLLRDRVEFLDDPDHKKLDSLRDSDNEKKLPDEIEISDYFDYDVLYILDDIIRESDREFLVELLDRLSRLDSVKSLILRLGIPLNEFDQVIHQVYIDLNTSLDNWLAKLMFDSFVLAYSNNFQSVDERVMFLQLCIGPLKDVLMKHKVMPNEVQGLLLWSRNEAKKRKYKKLWHDKAGLKPKNSVNRSFTSRYAGTLEKYKRDFTFEVITGDFTMSIAREKELEESLRYLHQGEKGAVLLVGPPGIGKTNMLKNLAMRMVVEDVPDELKDKRLVGFDFNKAFAESRDIDKFKNTIEKILKETAAAKNIILVIDDFDDLVNIREEYAGEVLSLITSSVDKYNIRLLATSSLEGYLSSIKPSKDLISRFDVVQLEEPSEEISLQILIDKLSKFEKKYRVKVSFDAMRRIVKLANSYGFDKVLPQKGIDLLEEAITYAKDEDMHFVTEKHVEKLVSKKVGVKVGAISGDEKKVLSTLEEQMHKRVIGQDKAIDEIANALRRARSGLVSEKKPVASFLFFGPTGVGKTEVAKTLADTYYGNEDAMIRLDMSEYQEEENLNRLIGYREGDDFFGGYLTEGVRERPFSLILLDEIEKANPKVLDIFLQVLDEGHITDGIGRDVSFSNTIIIATSNAGTKKIDKLFSEGKGYEEVSRLIQDKLKTVFRVEFLNRFDRVIMFKSLQISQIEKVAGLMMNKIARRIFEKGITLEYTPKTLKDLAKIGYNPTFGAREMRRAIQVEVEDKIAELIVADKLDSGKTLVIDGLDNFQIK